jgi:hypothetical protein
MDQGTVWFMPGPRTLQVIDECAAFPFARYKDWVDTVTQFLLWSRDKSFLQIPTDDLDLSEREQEIWKEHQATKDRRQGYGRVQGSSDRRWQPRSTGKQHKADR